MFSWFRRRPHERPGFFYTAPPRPAARQPFLFAACGIPDTRAGRFEAICLFVALLIRRLRQDADARGPALAQAVFDAMFADMDRSLRELGVGDLSVGKKNRELWEAFHGRARAYEAALADGRCGDALPAAIGRNLFAGALPPGRRNGWPPWQRQLLPPWRRSRSGVVPGRAGRLSQPQRQS